MRLLFFGDSITDAHRDRPYQDDFSFTYGLGSGFVNIIATELIYNNPSKYEVINTGIGGNGIVDLYNRIKKDCWHYKPDVISILIGVNDIWHEVQSETGVEINRFKDVYRLLIKHTKEALQNTKIVLLEPFVQEGVATSEHYDMFIKTLDYAKVVKDIAQEFNLVFVPLQKPLDEYAEKYGKQYTLADGVHPTISGCKVIADEWLKTFRKEIDD